MSNWSFVVTAYAVTWTVIIGYALVIAARIGAARRRLVASGVAS